jgi:peptidoglycan hydrolase-like protein with peptidoglycan-binding domain
MFAIGFSAVATVCLTTGSATAANEWTSFTVRAQESQGVGGRAAREGQGQPHAAGAAVAGEATSFIDRVRASQGKSPSGAEARETYASPAITSEATSFIARVEASQGIKTSRELAGAEELSPEGVRLVQRALTAKGHATGITGKLDESTRSSLMGFQRENALPASGALDEETVEALGLDVSQVRPVRGAEER